MEFDNKSTQTVQHGEVSMVRPQMYDMVVVTRGENVGVKGDLVCLDGDDSILKDATGNFRIVVSLGKNYCTMVRLEIAIAIENK